MGTKKESVSRVSLVPTGQGCSFTSETWTHRAGHTAKRSTHGFWQGLHGIHPHLWISTQKNLNDTPIAKLTEREKKEEGVGGDIQIKTIFKNAEVSIDANTIKGIIMV